MGVNNPSVPDIINSLEEEKLDLNFVEIAMFRVWSLTSTYWSAQLFPGLQQDPNVISVQQ